MDKTIRALERGIDFLDYLAEHNGETRTADLVKALELPSSTVLRIAKTLEIKGLVTRHPLSGNYHLGSQVLHYGRSYLRTLDYRDVSRDIMKNLRDGTKETVSLYVRQRDSRVCIEKFEGPEPLRASIQVGDILPLVSGAAGKVILAFDGKERREIPLGLLEEIRLKGYSTSHAEYQEGVSSVAAPIFDFHESAIAALSVSGPSSRFEGVHLENIIRLILSGSKEISALLGYHNK